MKIEEERNTELRTFESSGGRGWEGRSKPIAGIPGVTIVDDGDGLLISDAPLFLQPLLAIRTGVPVKVFAKVLILQNMEFAIIQASRFYIITISSGRWLKKSLPMN